MPKVHYSNVVINKTFSDFKKYLESEQVSKFYSQNKIFHGNLFNVIEQCKKSHNDSYQEFKDLILKNKLANILFSTEEIDDLDLKEYQFNGSSPIKGQQNHILELQKNVTESQKYYSQELSKLESSLTGELELNSDNNIEHSPNNPIYTQ